MLTLLGMGAQVRPFLEHSCTILSFFKIVIIFNITSPEIKTKSADVLLKKRAEDRVTVFLKWTDFILFFFQNSILF